jgi:ribose transport system ATP-binding protein
MASPTTPRLQLEDVSKTFPGQRALDRVSLTLQPGEVRALLGANGSGKSTLVKILAGVYSLDAGAGALAIDGEPVGLPVAPSKLPELGMSFVHQDLGLIERRPVLENLAYGRPFLRKRLGLIDWKRERARASAILEQFGADISLDALVISLTKAEQAMVAIMRAFDLGGADMRVLVLDEPTVGLPPAGADQLLETVRAVAASGVAVIYVSHVIEEVERVCDTVTVLRDGQLVLDAPTAGMTRPALIEAITGHVVDVAASRGATPSGAADGPTALAVHGLQATTLRGIDVRVAPGEVVGIVGDLDSGANEVLPAIYGSIPAEHADLSVGGQRVRRHGPRAMCSRGAGYVPGNRAVAGLLSGMTLGENLTCLDLASVSVGPLIHPRRDRRLAQRLIDGFAITPGRADNRIENLSGGNQQKALLARWLHGQRQLLLIDEPTQGVDIGAKAEIHRQIRVAAEDGAAFLVHSTDLEEVERLCDRVLVLQRGVIVRELRAPTIGIAALRHAMFDTERLAA